MRTPPYDLKATKQTVSVTINSNLYAQAKGFAINTSQVAEEALAAEVARYKAERLKKEIRSGKKVLRDRFSPALLCMQLYDIAVGNEMIRPYLLSVECGAAPQPCEPELASNVVIHEPRYIEHSVAATYGEGPLSVRRLSEWLRVHAHNLQRFKQEPCEMIEPVARLGRAGDCRKAGAR
jgi:hypothetical protein